MLRRLYCFASDMAARFNMLPSTGRSGGVRPPGQRARDDDAADERYYGDGFGWFYVAGGDLDTADDGDDARRRSRTRLPCERYRLDAHDVFSFASSDDF